MAHLTAGDITPLAHIEESTFGTTPAGSLTYYGDIREGGSITPTDNPNPYINWRYRTDGRRGYDGNDYVTQNAEAGFTDAIEVRDQSNWYKVFDYAGVSTTALSAIPSRTVQFGFKQDSNNTQYALTYRGCKTDTLRVAADAPGGVVKFDETVFASLRDTTETTFVTTPSNASVPAVQWVKGVTIRHAGDMISTMLYPQSFALTIRNNLGRANTYDTDLGTNKAIGLLEGRQEIEFEMSLWMEDFTYMVEALDGPSGNTSVSLGLYLGADNQINLSMNAFYMSDGTNQSLVQDKQLQTLRFRTYYMMYSTS